MEYKICENCGAKIHVRTLKCPICNIILTEASKIVTDEIPTSNFEKNEDLGENIDIQIDDNNITNNISQNNLENLQTNNDTSKEVKDYVYKAEVRHSLEYTKPLANGLKVFITAISMFPLLGQFFGTFLGIFFASCDDNDRRSFGRALILLSVFMFMLFAYSLMLSSQILSSGDITNYFNNFTK